jgi:hypothetical protein
MSDYVYAPKADANHSEVAGWYEELMCLTLDVHKLPGFVDLLVRIPTRGGAILQLVEIKTGEGKIKASQERFMRDWGGFVVAVIRTQADVAEHVERVQGRFK